MSVFEKDDHEDKKRNRCIKTFLWNACCNGKRKQVPLFEDKKRLKRC